MFQLSSKGIRLMLLTQHRQQPYDIGSLRFVWPGHLVSLCDLGGKNFMQFEFHYCLDMSWACITSILTEYI